MSNIVFTAERRLAVAHHEAGHVWAYWVRGVSFASVAVGPCAWVSPGNWGQVNNAWPRQATTTDSDLKYIFAAGPIAAAVYSMKSDPAGSWDAHLTRQMYGRDFERSGRLLQNPGAVAEVRAGIERDWSAIVTLAEKLMKAKVLGSRDALAILQESRRAPPTP